MNTGILAMLAGVLIAGSTPACAGTLDARLALLLQTHSVARAQNAGAATASVAAGGLRIDTAGRVQVYVHPASGISIASLVAALAQFGATQVVSAPVMGIAQAWVPANRLRALAALREVGRVSVPAYVHAPLRPPAPNARAALAQAIVPTGLPIDSSAPAAMQAPVLVANGMNGAGIKVGVMSGDISGLAVSQAAGYLPASIWDDPGLPGTAPIPGNPAEGTALLEIVHAVAAQASLGFCAPVTSVDVLTCFKDLVHWGATVIVNDMQLHTTDMFAAGLVNDGSLAWAAEQIAEANPGVAFVNIAGNEAQDYFQAPYTPGPGATLNGTHYSSLMDFGAATGGASATRLAVHFNYVSEFTPVLEWNDPLKSGADSFVMALVDQNGNVLASGTAFTTSDGRPGISLSYAALDVSEPAFLEIACRSCANPVTLKLDGFADGAGTFGMNTGGAVGFGQATIPGTLTVAAAEVLQLDPLAMVAEFFTSPGPFLYGDVGSTGSEVKPEVSGIDNVIVSGAGGFSPDGPAAGGGVTFLGTSAAVPNVAGLLADILSGNPGVSAASLYSAVKSSADRSAFPAPGAVSAFDPAQAGAGLVQGVGAWNALSSRTIPLVNAVDPPSAMPGGAFNISVNGSGFMQGARVIFNGTPLATTFTSATALSAQVPAALAASPGTFKLNVSNPDPANTVSNTVNYLIGNPVPEISSWSPQQVTAGSAAFTLTVNGRNFVSGSIIDFDNSTLTTSFVSATQLTATVPASAVAQAGSRALMVVSPDSAGDSPSVNFLVQAPLPSPPPSTKSAGGGASGALILLVLFGLLVARRRRADWREPPTVQSAASRGYCCRCALSSGIAVPTFAYRGRDGRSHAENVRNGLAA